MGWQERRRNCGILFWSKALLSLSISIGVLAYYIVRIAQLYTYARDHPSVGSGEYETVDCPFDPAKASSPGELASFGHRLEPAQGDFLWGFHLDWEIDSPSALVKRLGAAPPVWNAFISMNTTDFEVDVINWMANQIRDVKGIFELTILPTVPLDTLPRTLLWELAQECRHINSFYGVPVYLRFAHEMNGNWLVYGQKPTAFRQAFIDLANYVHTSTNLTAMVWSPNTGLGYPYGQVTAGAADLALLDTNRDGVVTAADDPYLPYWPGAAAVDWVGVSAYNLLAGANSHQALAPLTGDLAQHFYGNDVVTNGIPIHDIYNRFAAAEARPFMLSETGAPWYRNGTTEPFENTEFEVKQGWWRAVFGNTLAGGSNAFPNFKMATWFEETKVESAFYDANVFTIRDYYITQTKEIARAFIKDAQDLGKNAFKWAGRVKFECDGSLRN
ncbi:hypothetical protein CXG81DRAFT_25762 [Caulochytrium protostelioides]|uniref:GH26 domain-containing protein n=1 Tax=Caulochytrium protostelioides TaxID=1555241 RepID=A0A4P9X904_9FUNG|nr:hypothetical protein CXG81DRAFT_25762 [Caulochytrium protostelioides]|eukprot:RKP01550.1 hypothetical protein CXG81DRAFT_25762 [Caulochytrium protostelioides]